MQAFEFVERTVRGDSMPQAGVRIVRIPPGIRKKRQLLAVLAAQLELPDYFGHNWDALEECLGDLAWLAPACELIVAHADLPCRENPDTLASYLSILADRARQTNRPITVRVQFPASTREAIARVRSS